MGDFVIENGVLKKYTGPGGDVVIPDGVTRIGDEAFLNSQGLMGVTIPESVTSIGSGAFGGCYSLRSVTLPKGITSIDSRAFIGCCRLTAVTIPDSVTGIDGWAFSGCTGLTRVTLPASLTSIGNEAFRACSSLTSVTIPEGVTSIGIRAFEWCDSLTSVTIPEGVTCIGDGTFQRCESLTSVTIPSSVTSIGYEAFWCCNSLMAVTFLGTDEQLGSIFIEQGNDRLCDLLLKNGREPTGFCGGAVSWHFTADGVLTIGGTGKMTQAPWLNYGVHAHTVIVGSGVESLLMDNPFGKGSLWACWGDHSLERFSVEEGSKHYTSIDGVLFNKKGTRLEAFPPAKKDACYSVPESVETIRAWAFQNSRVKFVQLPRTVEKLPKNAFEDIYVSTWSPEAAAKLNNPVYLGDVDDLPAKVKNSAVQGFLYALAHGVREMEPWADSYADYIKRNSKTYVKQAEKDKKLLRLMLEKKLLGDSDVKTLLKNVKGAEMKTALLTYQQEQFGGKKQKDEFSLEDSDPAMKRAMQMAQRREQIKDQKGIVGLNFVATGEMNRFGYYDEYTNAHNFDDLKCYIEERGGHLRSAVSSKTDYLICNDPASTTVKSKKAAELGVSVITEAQFLQMAEGEMN